MGVRVVAGTYVVLGPAAACFALYAIALDPASLQQLQIQVTKELDPHPPEPGQTSCAETAAEAMETRELGMVLLLWAAAQAFMAMAALMGDSRVLAVWAQLLSLPMASRLTWVLAGVVHVSIGLCHHHAIIYCQVLLAGYPIVAVPFALFFVTGLIVTLCGKADG